MAHHGFMSKFKSMFFFMAHMIFSLKFNNNSFYLSMVTFMLGENRLYRPYFCILNIKNHIMGLKRHKSCPQQGPCAVRVLHWALQGPLKGPCDFRDSARLCLTFLKKYRF